MQYGVKILVITSFRDTCYIEILPTIQKSERGKRCILVRKSVLFLFLLLDLSAALNVLLII